MGAGSWVLGVDRRPVLRLR